VVDDDPLAVLLAEEVGPAGVEAERLVGREADRREERDLSGEQQADTPGDHHDTAPGKPWPQPDRADEQQCGAHDRQHQHLVAR